jgi:hypothetical protein
MFRTTNAATKAIGTMTSPMIAIGRKIAADEG